MPFIGNIAHSSVDVYWWSDKLTKPVCNTRQFHRLILWVLYFKSFKSGMYSFKQLFTHEKIELSSDFIDLITTFVYEWLSH